MGGDDLALLQMGKMGGGPLAGLAALGLGGLNTANTGLNPAGMSLSYQCTMF